MALRIGILLPALAALAAAFGTINEPIFVGQHNEHEMITRLAFQWYAFLLTTVFFKSLCPSSSSSS
jgi:hypothetical protein